VIYPYKIEKALTGDLEAIEQICAATWEPIYRFIYAKVQNREEAEDITQETYCKTLVYWREHKSLPENLLGYMKTIALNLVRDRWRQKKRRGTQISFAEENPEEIMNLDQQMDITRRLQIEKAIAGLSEDQRKIIDLRIIKGYSVAETARLTNKTEAAVRTSQYRALQALALILNDND
jgi:RNA polymerase sigma-70 factor (ECF subfamily)